VGGLIESSTVVHSATYFDRSHLAVSLVDLGNGGFNTEILPVSGSLINNRHRSTHDYQMSEVKLKLMTPINDLTRSVCPRMILYRNVLSMFDFPESFMWFFVEPNLGFIILGKIVDSTQKDSKEFNIKVS
jgi:hypothetical protein